MKIRVSRELEVSLQAPDDLKRFKMVLEVDRKRLPAVGKALAGIALLDGVEVAWVSADWLRQQSGLSESPEWNQRFEGMLEFARKHGWVREAPVMVRCHLEWAGD